MSRSIEKDAKESYDAYEPILEENNCQHIRIQDNTEFNKEGNNVKNSKTNLLENLNLSDALNSPRNRSGL